MIWVLSLLVLSILVLCLILAVVTLWQNLEREKERANLWSGAQQRLQERVADLEGREAARLQTAVGNPNVGYMETLAEKVRLAGPMAGSWTNPVAERHPEIQP